MRIANAPRTGVNGSPGSVGGRLAPRSVVTGPRAAVMVGPGAKTVLLLDEILNGTNVTGAMRARTVRRSTGRSVLVTRPGTKTVLLFSQVLDGASVTTTPRRCAPRRRTNSGQTATVVMAPPIASPQANAGFLGGLVLDGTGNA